MGKHDDLMVAVRKSDSQAVVKLLVKCLNSKSKLMGSGKKLNINQLDNNGLSALHQAALSGSLDIAKSLLDHGASVDLADHKGIRPLHLAAEGGHLELVSFLVQRGASSSDPSFDDVTPLHIACQRGHLSVVDFLLQHGSDPTVFNSLRKTPLDLACESGHETIVELLLKDPDGPCRRLLKTLDQKAQNDLFLTSCLHLAAAKGYTNIVRRLLDVGCDVSRCTRDGTSLHVSVAGGHLDVVNLLLSRAVDLSRVNCYKQTAYDVACRLPQSRDNLQLKQLLQQAADQTTLEQPPPVPYVGINIYDIPSQDTDAGLREIGLCKHTTLETNTSSRGQCTEFEPSTQQVPDVVHCTSIASIRRPSDSSLINRRRHGNEDEMSPMSRFTAPIRSSNDLNQDLGSIVLHASFDSSEIHAPRSPAIRYSTNTQQPRNQSPVDQIVTLPPDDIADGMRAVRGTDSPGSSASGMSNSSSGSSGYSGSTGQIASSGMPMTAISGFAARQQNRLSGYSCESGVASSCASSSRHSYLSVASSSSHSSLNRLPEDNESAYSSVLSFQEFYERGFPESEIVRTWLSELHLDDFWTLFINAGYDMPTISRMTPEDLTAIGITQPTVRKKLTAEISRLHTLINDGIPNYRPNELREWLRLLRLDEYYETLSADKCYSDMDKVTDITWEDLEDIGITKLGHQKKIMLAIDRLKKLKTSGRRFDHTAVDQQPLPSPRIPEVSYQSASQILSDGRHFFSSSTSSSPGPRSVGSSHNSFTFEAPLSIHPCVQLENRTVRTPEIVNLFGSRRSPVVRPEMVAIQVKRNAAAGGTATPELVSASNGSSGNTVYESFHGVCVTPDLHSFVKAGVPMDGNELFNEKSSAGDVQYTRTRWNSGGSSVPSRGSPVCRRGSHLTIAADNSLLDSATASPSSPARSPNKQLGSGSSLRRIPPAPPRRTNSIKVIDGIAVNGQNDEPSSLPYATASLGRKKTYSGINSELHVAVSNNDLAYSSSDFESAVEFSYQTLRPSNPGYSSPQSMVSGSRETIDSFGPGDSGTLPFANENVGTIRPRGVNHSTSSSTSTSFDYDTHTLRRKGPKKPLSQHPYTEANSATLKPTPTSLPEMHATQEKVCLPGADSNANDEASGGVFDDIENMFHGLTNELNELLTQPE